MDFSKWKNLIVEIIQAIFAKKEVEVPITFLPSIPDQPLIQVTPKIMNPDTLLQDWSVQKNAYHNVRVLCDLAGLTVEQKNLICAVVYQESQFINAAKCRNKNALGVLTSTDWGICQINDAYHIGSKLDFPSVEYVLENPDKVVNWMIGMYKEGKLSMWVGYSSSAYRAWLVSSSPMWSLSTPAALL